MKSRRLAGVESHISVDGTVAHSVTSIGNQEYLTAGRNSPPELPQYSQGRQRKVIGSFWVRYHEFYLALYLVEDPHQEVSNTQPTRHGKIFFLST